MIMNIFAVILMLKKITDVFLYLTYYFLMTSIFIETSTEVL